MTSTWPPSYDPQPPAPSKPHVLPYLLVGGLVIPFAAFLTCVVIASLAHHTAPGEPLAVGIFAWTVIWLPSFIGTMIVYGIRVAAAKAKVVLGNISAEGHMLFNRYEANHHGGTALPVGDPDSTRPFIPPT